MKSETVYKVPASIERETEKAVLDENLGWLPKSQIEITEQDNNHMRWIVLPAWIAKQKMITRKSYGGNVKIYEQYYK